MADEQEPGIRTPLWIAGRFIIRGPAPLQLTPKRFEVATRTSNLALRMDRPYIAVGDFALPNIRSRHELALPWSTVQEAELIEHLDLLVAKGQPFDMGIWKHTYDIFDGDGSTTTFFLQRRQLLPAVTPPTLFPSYPTKVDRYSAAYGTTGATATPYTVVQKTTAEIDAGTPGASIAWIESTGRKTGNLWVSKIKVNPAPADVADSLVVSYMPLYSVVIEEERPRSYVAGIVEPRGFTLAEFG